MTKSDRNYIHYLEDIFGSITKILRYTDGMDFQEFKKNDLVTDAVIRNFEIIGEASNHIPDQIKERHSDIRWKAMVGLRNLVIHEYFGIDYETIWTIITENLPDDKVNVELAIEQENNII